MPRPSSSEDESDLEPNPNPNLQVNLVDKFVRKMEQEKKRQLKRVGKTFTQIEARLQAIKEESKQLEAARTKLQAEQTTLQNANLNI